MVDKKGFITELSTKAIYLFRLSESAIKKKKMHLDSLFYQLYESYIEGTLM